MSQTSARRPRVLVLFGGRSGEHPISAVTAGGVLRAIDRTRYDVLAVGITRDGRWVLADDDPDRWAITDGRLPEVTNGSVRVLLPQAAGERAVQALRGSVAEAMGDVDVVFPLLIRSSRHAFSPRIVTVEYEQLCYLNFKCRISEVTWKPSP